MIIAVFPDETTARRAAQAAVAAGAKPEHVRVDSPHDEVPSMRAEMAEEVEHTFMGAGNVGPFTKEQSKGMALGVPIATILGAALALPFGFIPMGELGLGGRLLIVAVIGAVAGSVIGFMAGGEIGSKITASQALATERGVTVAVADSGEPIARVVEALEASAPIRIDLVAAESGDPLGTITSEEADLRTLDLDRGEDVSRRDAGHDAR